MFGAFFHFFYDFEEFGLGLGREAEGTDLFVEGLEGVEGALEGVADFVTDSDVF